MNKWQETEIGRIPVDWRLKIIDEIKSSKKHAIAMGPFGSNIKKENFREFGVPVIRGNNLNEFVFDEKNFVFLSEQKANSLKSSLCFKNDIVFTHRGTIGQVGFITENSKFNKYVISQSGMKLSCNEEIVNSKFIFLFFKTKIGQHLLLRNTSQTGVPSISKPTTSLKEIFVPVPPKNEADEIVDVIFTIQNKIDNLRKQNETLEQIAQTLFKQWFVEFEFPNEEGKPYKSSGGKMVESELGEIPEGWKVGKLGDLLELIIDYRGKTPKKLKMDWSTIGIPALSAKNIKNGKIVREDSMNHGSEELFNIWMKDELRKDDILLTSEAPLGELYYLADNKKYILSQRLYALRAKNNYTSPYIYYWLNSYAGKYFLNRRATGSTVVGIRQSELRKVEILIPENDILKKSQNILKEIIYKKHKNYKAIKTLSQIRDTLLPKLMSGEIRVK
ncbi:MAG: restriction endonuclease subunit S [Fidelibacterota bacterium]